ncbi:hypothetical protein HI914_04862 [Erysiphe necator]|nr:hypothetical protein HI914_04862 [Erysiphe necator]
MSQSTVNPETVNCALEDYFDWEYKAWVEILADLEQDTKEHFLPLDAVRSYFTTCDSQLQRNLDKILVEIFNMDSPPVNSDLILRDHIATFCILLQIDRGRYIEHFTCFEELSDNRLPFDSAHPPGPFPTVMGDYTFFQEFCEVQRRYCVPIFNSHMLHKNFGHQRLLPITFKERLQTRGVAAAHIIRLYGPHNKMTRESVKVKNPNSNTFVIKSYSTTRDHDLYTKQVNTFRSFKNADGILKFFGSFEYRGQSHILLEFADKGTLIDFFKTEAPPTRGDQIIDFWENILQLTKGLKAIHSVKGIHNDIFSENILVLSNGTRLPSNWLFKFSNPGTMSESNNYTGQLASMSIPEDSSSVHLKDHVINIESKSDHQGTKSLVNVDIWRLGCIFSQAAFWIADGYKGILDFERKFGDNIDIIKTLRIQEEKKISENIIDAHAEIENHLRRSDHITKDLLTDMIDEMLWPEDHPNIDILIEKAESMIATARQTLSEVSSKKSSRPRSQSRNTSRVCSPAPPVPLILKKDSTELPLSKPRFPRRCGSLRVNFNHHSNSLSSKISVASDIKSSASGIKTTNLYTFNSMSKITSGLENKSPVTSWFLDSPTTDSPFTVPRLPSMRNKQFHSLSSESDLTFAKETSIEINLPSKSYQSKNPSQAFDESRETDTTNKSFVNNETVRSATYEVCLPSKQRTIPLQNTSHEYRLPPLAPYKSPFQNMQSENVKPFCPQFESFTESNHQSLSACTSINPKINPEESYPQSRPHTSIDVKRHNSIHRLKLENDTYQRIFNLSDQPIPSSMETSVISNDRCCNESISSSACSSLTNKSAASSFLSKSRRLSSFNSRRNSLRSMPENGVSLSRTATARSTFCQSLNEFHDQNKIAHIDINTCRYWKHLNKTSRRKSKVPLLPGAYLLLPLKKYDHIFIIDDSVSMAPHWPEVCLVFESLSYVVKGMSPLGTQLFFTISSESLRKKGTHDLCQFVSEKRLQRAQTNIAKRLDLQLAAYRLKLWESNKRTRDVRPVNFYILSNGLWTPESYEKLRDTIEQTALLLSQFGLKNQVYLSFIGFESTSAAAHSIETLSSIDWGDGLRVGWSWWTGNIWGMLRGDLVNIERNGSTLCYTNEPPVDEKNYDQNLIIENKVFMSGFNGNQVIGEVEGLYELA